MMDKEKKVEQFCRPCPICGSYEVLSTIIEDPLGGCLISLECNKCHIERLSHYFNLKLYTDHLNCIAEKLWQSRLNEWKIKDKKEAKKKKKLFKVKIFNSLC